jgi:YD repeat-containing protein
MRLSLLSVLAPFVFAGSLFAQATAVPAGQSHFTIVEANDGKTVGSADCNVSTVPSGYQITSHGELKMPKFTYSFSNDNHLDSQLNIVHDQLSGQVNGTQVTFTLGSDPSGRQFQVSIDANGKTTTNVFDRHQHTVLLPDLDPAAYSAMAHFAIEKPATTWIVIPKQEGLLVPALYTDRASVHGTFHGQPVDARHTTVTVSDQNGITVELYYTGEGALLEADLPEQNFYVIRDDFKLQARPHYEPPRGTAPPSQGAPQQPGQQPPPQYSVPPSGSPQVQPQALLQAY